MGRVLRTLGIVLLAASGLWLLRNVFWIANPEVAVLRNPDIPSFAAPGLVIGKLVVLLIVGLDYLIALANILLRRYEYAKFAVFGTTLLLVAYAIEAMLWATRHPAVWSEFALWGAIGMVNLATGAWYVKHGERVQTQAAHRAERERRLREEDEVPMVEMPDHMKRGGSAGQSSGSGDRNRG